MAPRKPAALIVRHETREEKAQRLASEDAMTPREPLQATPPKNLKGQRAREVWKKTISLYKSVEGGKIATAFDSEVLIIFCELIEDVKKYLVIRDGIDAKRAVLEKQIAKPPRAGDEAGWKNYLKLQDQLIAIVGRLCSLDSRVDSKRAKIHDLAQSLYLTPRARAGMIPAEKDAEPERSEMEKLLDGDF